MNKMKIPIQLNLTVTNQAALLHKRDIIQAFPFAEA